MCQLLSHHVMILRMPRQMVFLYTCKVMIGIDNESQLELNNFKRFDLSWWNIDEISPWLLQIQQGVSLVCMYCISNCAMIYLYFLNEIRLYIRIVISFGMVC